MTERIELPKRCYDGVVPSVIATCDLDGEPNVTYLSQVHWVDDDHVALSCQFFNKTKRNVGENPHAAVVLYDPLTFEAYRLRLCFDHVETDGPLFERIAARIEVIASHTGMAGVFKLQSADVYRVLSRERLDGFLVPADPVLDAEPTLLVGGPLTELRALQLVSDRIARARALDELLDHALADLDELLGFRHATVFLPTPDGRRLVAAAAHGYSASGDRATAVVGEGLVGTVAERRLPVRFADLGSELSYGRAIRTRAADAGLASIAPELPVVGLADAQAWLGQPLVAGGELVGVLAVESESPLAFDEWDEAFVQIVANQLAAGIERVRDAAPADGADPRPVRHFTFFQNDDCVFFEGEYLVRNVPGRILWKLLNLHAGEGRTAFTNRELRLDPRLGLPAYRDNLESRLILLRRRLEERCPELRIVSTGRGRFSLEVGCVPVLLERETG